MVYGVLVVSREQISLATICCNLLHLGVTIGISKP